MLDAVEAGDFDVVRVTHKDRLARFGTVWLERILAQNHCSLEVLHPGSLVATEELLNDFMALVASFTRRMYGQRTAATKRRLLERAKEAITK